ncbi:MAG: DUF1573 domain-containing protein [bacterium]|nr:DUF1573 domain-containing protein [bacterium]
MKLIIAIVVGTVLIAGLVVFLPSIKPSTGGEIKVTPLEYELGDISMAKGLVVKSFEVENVGTGILKLDNIWTSCHCTSAIFKLNGKTSQIFGMPMGSGVSFWSESLSPGEKGDIEVTFDPAYHGPSGTGPVVRGVYISSNDPKNKRVEIKLAANVLP